MPRAPQSCRYVFTFNNPYKTTNRITEDGDHEVIEYTGGLLDFSDQPEIRYCIYSEECGESGTNHFQGYIELFRKKSITWFNENVPVLQGARLAICIAPKEAIEYCKKKDDPTFISGPYEYGNPQHPGTRTDISECKRRIDEGANLKQISNEHFDIFLRYHTALKHWYELNVPDIEPTKPNVIVFYGPPGTGKSEKARQLFPKAYVRPSDSRFWLQYNGQRDIILDDFAGQFEISDFLRLTDCYGYVVRQMFGSHPTSFQNVILTTNILPWMWYSSYPYKAISRRIDGYYFFNYDVDPVQLPVPQPPAAPDISGQM